MLKLIFVLVTLGFSTWGLVERWKWLEKQKRKQKYISQTNVWVFKCKVIEIHEGLHHALELYNGGEMTVKKIYAITHMYQNQPCIEHQTSAKRKTRAIRSKYRNCSCSYWEFLYSGFVNSHYEKEEIL